MNLAKSGIIRFGVESGMIRIRNSSAPDFFPRDSSDIKQKQPEPVRYTSRECIFRGEFPHSLQSQLETPLFHDEIILEGVTVPAT